MKEFIQELLNMFPFLKEEPKPVEPVEDLNEE